MNDLMAKLNVEMSKTVTRDAPLLKDLPGKGRYCAAKSIADGIWYRARVVETISTGKNELYQNMVS